jgi:hypothetical protein
MSSARSCSPTIEPAAAPTSGDSLLFEDGSKVRAERAVVVCGWGAGVAVTACKLGARRFVKMGAMARGLTG